MVCLGGWFWGGILIIYGVFLYGWGYLMFLSFRVMGLRRDRRATTAWAQPRICYIKCKIRAKQH